MNNMNDLFKIKYNKELPEPGKILISEPFLKEYPFSRSVTLLVNHSADGSMGLVLNMPIAVTLNDIMAELQEIDEIPLFRGGPIGEDILFFVHSIKDLPGAVPIIDNLYLNGDFEILKQKLIDKKVDPNNMKFFLGYSGWGANQLHHELEADSWLVSREPIAYLLNQSPYSLWKDVLQNMGSPYSLWARYPLLPALN